jgi:diguanylate cyclase (GGDEF)-like protein/PAS domain S-box-containing protein
VTVFVNSARIPSFRFKLKRATTVTSNYVVRLQELEFYRQQCNDLGKRLLRLQEDQRQSYREAQRAQLIAQLLRQTYASANEVLLNRSQLDQRYLEAIITTTHYDRAALLQKQPQCNHFRIVAQIGFTPAKVDELLELTLLPPNHFYCNSRTPIASPIPELRAFFGLPYFLWVYEPQTGLALALNNGYENFITPLFDDKDLEICTAALDVYIHLDRRRQAEEDLGKFSLALQQASTGVLIIDADGIIEYANSALCELVGPEIGRHLIRQPIDILQTRYPLPEHYQALKTALQQGSEWKGELVVAKPEQPGWEYTSLTPIRNSQQHITHFLMVSEDISLRKEYEQRLFQQAHYDALTGLPNRALAMDRLTQTLATARREHHMVAILFLDLDKFKLVNDTLGHLVGDALLVEMAQRLHTRIRESDTLARLGGDEFLCILPKINSRDDVERISGKLLEAFTEPVAISGQSLHISTSIGIALYPTDGDEPHTLLRNADAALYQAKDLGRNTYYFFTQHLNVLVSERMDLESRLRQALDRHEFQIHYQPVINLSNGEILGMEALLRWYNADLGLIPPDRFIPIAEETGLIIAIGHWVLHRACQDMAEWQRRHRHAFHIMVNVSERQVRANAMWNSVMSALENSQLPPECLTLEITESLLMDSRAEILAQFKALRAHGVGLAIDDFGTGYSSLGYLQRYPFSKLKIDRTFTQHLGEDPKATTLVRAILAMARNLGLQTVAEGIESASQYDFLQMIGCDYGQGFFLSKPLVKDEISALLQNTYLPIP